MIATETWNGFYDAHCGFQHFEIAHWPWPCKTYNFNTSRTKSVLPQWLYVNFWKRVRLRFTFYKIFTTTSDLVLIMFAFAVYSENLISTTSTYWVILKTFQDPPFRFKFRFLFLSRGNLLNEKHFLTHYKNQFNNFGVAPIMTNAFSLNNNI